MSDDFVRAYREGTARLIAAYGYNPAREQDSCGVGLIAALDGKTAARSSTSRRACTWRRRCRPTSGSTPRTWAVRVDADHRRRGLLRSLRRGLHRAGVVDRLAALRGGRADRQAGARIRYTTVQNWSQNVYNLVTKRAIAETDATVEWVDCNLAVPPRPRDRQSPGAGGVQFQPHRARASRIRSEPDTKVVQRACSTNPASRWPSRSRRGAADAQTGQRWLTADVTLAALGAATTSSSSQPARRRRRRR